VRAHHRQSLVYMNPLELMAKWTNARTKRINGWIDKPKK
jgi:hypothetical protein